MSLDESTKNLLTDIAENIPKVKQQGYDEGYGEGRTDEWSDFWDVFQQGGNRKNYSNAFYDEERKTWTAENFKPKHSIKPTSLNGAFLGLQVTDFAKVFENRGIEFDTSQCTNMNGAFSHHTYNTRLPIIDLSSATNINLMCRYNYYLQKIDKIIWSETIKNATNPFLDCQRLEEFESEGKLAISISFSYSPLTVETAIGLMLCLKNFAGTTNAGLNTLTLNDNTKAAMAELGAIEEFNNKTYTEYLASIGWVLG